ncbi:MAG: hypothetical protein KAH56_09945 [Candidatus Krumholzibacteria bacterium]|nr:hypothetical protein [Candidatus Krumholzibacteria bacterium]
MKIITILLAIFAVVIAAGTATAGLDKHLEAFEPFVGKTMEGAFVNSATGESGVDVQRWEATLGGKAIRVVHSLNEGEYGGETIIFWDSRENTVAFYNFTTAGFYTHGTMTFELGIFTAHEKVEGGADGITEVRSSSRMLEDGRVHMKSEFLKDGEWVSGHEIYYVEAPDAKVVFK